MNDKNKADQGKIRPTLVPTQIIREIAKTRNYGLMKYPETGRDGWREIGLERIRDAAYRHFLAYLDDPTGLDEESGLPHISHLAANVSFLCELELAEPRENVTWIEKDKDNRYTFYDAEGRKK